MSVGSVTPDILKRTLIGYYSIEGEIDDRYKKTRRMLQGDGDVKLSETIRDPDFRQRASVVFIGVLAGVRDDMKSGNLRFRGDSLYNAAANASKINMDYTSLELMELAFATDKKAAPELEARLIRQRLSMSRITPAEAVEAIKKVLARVTGFDIHLVASESFNIGLHIADPAGMARVIQGALPEELKGISFVKLIGARLLFMGSTEADWSKGMRSYCDGLSVLPRESSAARWYEHSFQEIAGLLQQRPDLLVACGDGLANALGKSNDIKAFAGRFGMELTRKLMEMGAINRFLDSKIPSLE